MHDLLDTSRKVVGSYSECFSDVKKILFLPSQGHKLFVFRPMIGDVPLKY